MNPPQVYMCSPSWTLLPPPSLYQPSGSSQCTSPKHPVSLLFNMLWKQWHPTPVLLPGKSHGRRSLVGYSPWGRSESDRTELLHFHFHALETHSSVLAWRILGTAEPGGLPSMGSHRVRHNWSQLAAVAAARLVITSLPRSRHLLISWLQSPTSVILEPKKIKSLTVSTVSSSICH